MTRTRGPEEQADSRTSGPGDQGPEDQADQRTSGPGDQRTRGPGGPGGLGYFFDRVIFF